MKLRMYLRGLGIGMIVTAIIMTIALGSGGKKMTDAEIMSRARELGMVDDSTTLAEAVKSEPKQKEEAVTEPEKAEESVAEPEKVEESVAEPEKTETPKAEEKAEAPEKAEAQKVEEKTEAPEKAEEKIEEKIEEKPENKEDKAETDKKAEDKKEDVKNEKKEAKEEIADKAEDNKDKKEDVKTENKEEKTEEVKPITSTTSITIAGGCSSDTVARLLEKGGVIDNAAKFDDYLCKNGYDHKISTGKHDIPKGADYETIAKIITSGNR